MSRGLGKLQRAITWALLIAGDLSMPDLAQEVGCSDRSNLGKAVRRLERRGRVTTRMECGRDGRTRKIVRTRLDEASLLYPARDYEPSRLDDDDEEEEEEEEDLRDPEVLRRLKEEVWREAAKPLPGDAPEPPSPTLDEDALEKLRAAYLQLGEESTDHLEPLWPGATPIARPAAAPAS